MTRRDALSVAARVSPVLISLAMVLAGKALVMVGGLLA